MSRLISIYAVCKACFIAYGSESVNSALNLLAAWAFPLLGSVYCFGVIVEPVLKC